MPSCYFFVDIGIETTLLSFLGCKAVETVDSFYFPGRSSMRCHHLDPALLSCLPPKVSHENHIVCKVVWPTFLGAENVIVSILQFPETWI